MNRFVFILLALLSTFSVAFAQTGYYYNDQFIELIPDKNQHSTMSYSYAANHQFVSKSYHTKDVEGIEILPKIILQTKDSTYIRTILSSYKGILSINKRRGNIYYLNCNVKSSDDVLNLIQKLSSDKKIVWCEPDMILGKTCNSNPLYPQQFYLKNTGQFGGVAGIDINIEDAWTIVKGKPSVKVAVLDTGVDLNHEDLVEHLGQGYTAGSNTGDGSPQNIVGKKNCAHGTCCAGIIGATDNDKGIIGVASGVTIIPVNVEPLEASKNNGDGFASSSDVADAIIWAYKHADILSCSWGYELPVKVIESAIKEALTSGRNGKGTIVVVAAGNHSKEDVIETLSFPATIDGVIAVGAIDNCGKICYYSNQGKGLSVVAPSDHIYTTDISGEAGYSVSNYYSYFNGTSAACPQVSGIAALMLSANNNLTNKQVKDIIQKSAHDLGVEGWDETFGYGLVDAYRSVLYAIREQNMAISGPNVIEKQGTFTVNNLPSYCSIKWNQSPVQDALNSTYASLSYDATNPNCVIVNNYGSNGFSILLGASVIFPEKAKISPIELAPIYVTGDCSLSGIYYEEYANGDKSSEWPLVNTDFDETNSASAGSIVHVTSDNFRNRNVTYRFSDEYYGMNERTVQVTGNKIQFEMPYLAEGKSLIFTVSGGGVSSVHNFIFSAENTISSFDIKINKVTNNDVKIQLVENNNIDNSKTENCIVNIYNALNQNLVERKIIKTTSETISLSPGIYIVEAVAQGKRISRTFKIK